VPTLIFHGTNDASVDASQSIRYAERRPHVDLRLVDSDHELLDQKETIWSAMRMFFGSREDARA
jgi:pimeloyl-ACP methyl ester carboxylesterase